MTLRAALLTFRHSLSPAAAPRPPVPQAAVVAAVAVAVAADRADDDDHDYERGRQPAPDHRERRRAVTFINQDSRQHEMNSIRIRLTATARRSTMSVSLRQGRRS